MLLRGGSPTQLHVTVPTEKPRNGLAGLKHWPYDLRSGFTVAMISLPFSMGIAMTSGAPPICGSCRRSSAVSSCRFWAARM